jgi:hypothetical protein
MQPAADVHDTALSCGIARRTGAIEMGRQPEPFHRSLTGVGALGGLVLSFARSPTTTHARAAGHATSLRNTRCPGRPFGAVAERICKRFPDQRSIRPDRT